MLSAMGWSTHVHPIGIGTHLVVGPRPPPIVQRSTEWVIFYPWWIEKKAGFFVRMAFISLTLSTGYLYYLYYCCTPILFLPFESIFWPFFGRAAVGPHKNGISTWEKSWVHFPTFLVITTKRDPIGALPVIFGIWRQLSRSTRNCPTRPATACNEPEAQATARYRTTRHHTLKWFDTILRFTWTFHSYERIAQVMSQQFATR